MSDRVRKFILKNSFLYIIALILALKIYDVEEIGPASTEIGLSGVNEWFRGLFDHSDTLGYSGFWYGALRVTAYASIAVCLIWIALFVREMIKSGRLDGVGTDKNLMATFFLYVITVLICVVLRFLPVNYAPILREGQTAASPSFPAPYVLLIIISMGSTAFHAWDIWGEKKNIAKAISVLCIIVTAFGLLGGLFCGVYWFTDIIGAILFGVMLLMLYSFFFDL